MTQMVSRRGAGIMTALVDGITALDWSIRGAASVVRCACEIGCAAIVLCSLAFSSSEASAESRADTQAQPAGKARIDADGTVHLPAMAVPLSSYMSEEAKRLFIGEGAGFFQNLSPDLSIAQLRRAADDHYYRPILDRTKARYPVTIEERKIGGVPTYVVTPRDGVAPGNQQRVLVNFHGGGFIIGAGPGQIIESIPIAAVGKIKVISVDYRMAPEHHFPAASEDAARVYAELLKHYQPRNVGFYGCSAGGELSAQAVAWLQHQKLPQPGAIGIFGAGAYGSHTGSPTDAHVWGGDSRYMVPPLNGGTPLRPSSFNWRYWKTDYLAGLSKADLVSPLVAPALSPDVLKRFPPTLLITATRAVDLSAAVQTHRLLTNAGVEADLHVWDGLPHCFIGDADLPEAREAYRVITRFFDKHLGNEVAHPR